MKKDSLFSHKTIFSIMMVVALFFISSMAFGNHSYAEGTSVSKRNNIEIQSQLKPNDFLTNPSYKLDNKNLDLGSIEDSIDPNLEGVEIINSVFDRDRFELTMRIYVGKNSGISHKMTGDHNFFIEKPYLSNLKMKVDILGTNTDIYEYDEGVDDGQNFMPLTKDSWENKNIKLIDNYNNDGTIGKLYESKNLLGDSDNSNGKNLIILRDSTKNVYVDYKITYTFDRLAKHPGFVSFNYSQTNFSISPFLTTIKKYNDHTDKITKVGDSILYKIKFDRYFISSLYIEEPEDFAKFYIGDTLPSGMDKPVNISVDGIPIQEGIDNINEYGVYYTWDESNHYLKIIFDKEKNVKNKIWKGSELLYNSTVLSGADGEVKRNTADMVPKGSDIIYRTVSDIVIKGDPKISLSKMASPTTAKVGDSIHYALSLGKNTGNATLLAPVIKDILPEGMGKPANVVINSNGKKVNIKEGESNANDQGEYYTWDESSRTLTAYINSVGINDIKGIEYDSKVVSGNDGEEKINRATATGSNTTDKPSASAKVTIKGEPKLEISKTASPTSGKIGDVIAYKIYATNSGNAEPKNTTFTDVLPEGMGKPTDVTVKGVTIEVKLPEGAENATSDGEYYEWQPSSRTLIVHTTGLGVSTGQKTVTYKSKILSGNDGDKKKNIVTLSASNTTDKPTADATITVEDKKIKLHIKQEVINKNDQVVVPTTGLVHLNQVNVKNTTDIYDKYGLTIPSYEADTNKSFKTVNLVWNDTYQGYLPEDIVPEHYTYSGYILTDTATKHESSSRNKQPLPLIDYSSKNEYWLTIYIEPKIMEDGPPFYNWDYQVNDFGKIKYD